MIRFAALAVAALIAFGVPALAAGIAGHDMTLPSTERAVSVTAFKAAGDAKRPAVLMLHGAGGWGRRLDGFRHYASTLAANGIDAYLVSYYSDLDQRAMSSGFDIFENRYTAWTRMLGNLANDLIQEKTSNGQVGLIGFSNGGILSTGAGAMNPQIGAAVIYYGTEPWPLKTPVTHMPPLLILHGDADQIIPVENGKALAAFAKKIGTPAELVIYPGEPHGFGVDFTKKDATDAMNRTIVFLKRELKAK